MQVRTETSYRHTVKFTSFVAEKLTIIYVFICR